MSIYVMIRWSTMRISRADNDNDNAEDNTPCNEQYECTQDEGISSHDYIASS